MTAPTPAERRECVRPELHIDGACLHCENARLAAAVRDLADENERLRAALERITSITDQFGEIPSYSLHLIARTAIDPPAALTEEPQP